MKTSSHFAKNLVVQSTMVRSNTPDYYSTESLSDFSSLDNMYKDLVCVVTFENSECSSHHPLCEQKETIHYNQHSRGFLYSDCISVALSRLCSSDLPSLPMMSTVLKLM